MSQVPSLFDIAKQKGYSVTYIDNQHVLEDPTIRNYIDDKEASLVAQVYSPRQPEYVRDLASIEIIGRILKNTRKNFIFVNKVGAHFPYENTIDPQYRTNNRLQNYSISLQRNSIQFQDELSKSLIVIQFCFTHRITVKTFFQKRRIAIREMIFLQKNILYRLS